MTIAAQGILIGQGQFGMRINELNDLLFSNSHVLKSAHCKNRTRHLVLGPWMTDGKTNFRKLSFKAHFHAPVGKLKLKVVGNGWIECQQTQTLLKREQDEIIVSETTESNGFGIKATVKCTFLLLSAEFGSFCKIFGQISTDSIFKGLVEQQTIKQLKEFTDILINELHSASPTVPNTFLSGSCSKLLGTGSSSKRDSAVDLDSIPRTISYSSLASSRQLSSRAPVPLLKRTTFEQVQMPGKWIRLKKKPKQPVPLIIEVFLVSFLLILYSIYTKF